MLAQTYAAAVHGAAFRPVHIECDARKGLPSIAVVGLGGKTVDEAKERLRSALRNSDLKMPQNRITINLAPADIPKDGTALDLGMAIALLVAGEQVPANQAKKYLFLGELALDGSLRPVKGMLNMLPAVEKLELEAAIIPHANGAEAALMADRIKIHSAKNLSDVYRHLVGIESLPLLRPADETKILPSNIEEEIDLDDIVGQQHAKRALEIAAAGHHNLLFTGPPGTGKTMLAKTLIGIMPPPTKNELVEIIALHSLVQGEGAASIRQRPFRQPHHTASSISIVGGGQRPRPGEISLAHHGVLFLDEIPEYPRHVLESLRQPLEDKVITVARASDTIVYPASFMLIATQNPCPCGHFGDNQLVCSCSATQILNYQKRISGPLLDRIDMVVDVGKVDRNQTHTDGESSSEVADRIAKIRSLQIKHRGRPNAELGNKEIARWCQLSSEDQAFLDQAVDRLNLSMRSIKKVLRVARTIADIAGSEQIGTEHLAEALQYRHRPSSAVSI